MPELMLDPKKAQGCFCLVLNVSKLEINLELLYFGSIVFNHCIHELMAPQLGDRAPNRGNNSSELFFNVRMN